MDVIASATLGGRNAASMLSIMSTLVLLLLVAWPRHYLHQPSSPRPSFLASRRADAEVRSDRRGPLQQARSTFWERDHQGGRGAALPASSGWLSSGLVDFAITSGSNMSTRSERMISQDGGEEARMRPTPVFSRATSSPGGQHRETRAAGREIIATNGATTGCRCSHGPKLATRERRGGEGPTWEKRREPFRRRHENARNFTAEGTEHFSSLTERRGAFPSPSPSVLDSRSRKQRTEKVIQKLQAWERDDDDDDVKTRIRRRSLILRERGEKDARQDFEVGAGLTPVEEVKSMNASADAGQDVEVGDGLSLVQVLNSTNSSITPSITIRIRRDVSLRGLAQEIYFDQNVNITLKGECGNSRCLLEGGTDLSPEVREVNGQHQIDARGSISLYNIEFTELRFRFRQATLSMQNCVFRDCWSTVLEYLPEDLPEDSAWSAKTLLIDGCYFIRIYQGVVLHGLPSRACISRSVFVSRVQDEEALDVLVLRSFQEKVLSIRNTTFGHISHTDMDRTAHRGALHLQFVVPSDWLLQSAEDMTEAEVQAGKSTVSLVDCTFYKGDVLDPAFHVRADVQEGGPTAKANRSAEPLEQLRFCGGSFVGPANAMSGVDRGRDYDVNVTWIGGDRRLEVAQCLSPTQGIDGARKLKISLNRRGVLLLVDDNSSTTQVNGSCWRCRSESGVCDGVGISATAELFPLDPLPPQPHASEGLPLPAPGPSPPRRKRWRALPVAIAVPLGALVLCAIGVVLIAWRRRRRLRGGKATDLAKKISFKLSEDSRHLRIFTFKELEDATDNFANVVGKGGSGVVYKATLGSGEVVAVKSLEQDHWSGEKEFLHEVGTLGRVAHRNLVTLLGFCNENERYFLVFEFVPNGTLRDHLHKKVEVWSTTDSQDPQQSVSVLDWPTRVRVALEVGSAVEFLHHLLKPALVHRDIKPQNVLLRDDFTPKVADFGLCRKVNPQGDSLHTVPAGTAGYVAPEVFRGESVTEKVDVYSFGVVLLEMITGKQPFDEDFSLVRWVSRVAKDEQSAAGIADPKLQGHFDAKQLYLLTVLARACVRQRPEERPTMENVVRAMKSSMERLNPDESSASDTMWETNDTQSFRGRLYIPRQSFPSSKDGDGDGDDKEDDGDNKDALDTRDEVNQDDRSFSWGTSIGTSSRYQRLPPPTDSQREECSSLSTTEHGWPDTVPAPR